MGQKHRRYFKQNQKKNNLKTERTFKAQEVYRIQHRLDKKKNSSLSIITKAQNVQIKIQIGKNEIQVFFYALYVYTEVTLKVQPRNPYS